jgi:acyl-CoA synthetase (AMP-forming)/AMP-acid ligase II
MTAQNASFIPDRPLSLIEGPPLDSDALGVLTLAGWLTEVTARFADREALVFHEPDADAVRWTYAQLYERACQVARALTAAGLAKGETVAVLMTNRPEWLASVFGISLAGGVAAPLSTFSTPAELEYLLKASNASTLLFAPRVLKKNFLEILCTLEPAILSSRPRQITSAKFPYLRRLIALGSEAGGAVENWEDFLVEGWHVDQAQIDARIASITPADPALLYFSSGSTGRPKGVLNANRGVAVQCWRYGDLLGLRDGVRGWTANGFFWSGAFVQTVGATLTAGGTLVLQPTFDAERALGLFDRERVNYLVCWPHQYAQFPTATNWNAVDLSSIEYIPSGTPMDSHPTVSRTWREPAWAYGSTETFTISSFFKHGTPPEVGGNSHGVPLAGNQMKIVDPFTGEVLPRGERGEIAVKGATLMLGYIGVAAEETFDSEGYFHTGDGGYVDEKGRLVWEGRLNDIIKTGGANVSPQEIDEVLRVCPGVKIAQTVGVSHELYGEVIVSCVVRQDGSDLSEDAIKNFAKERLASYKIPKHILFVAEGELKTTGSSKIITAELRKIASERIKTAA